MKKYFVIEIIRYGCGALGTSLFGVYDDLEKAKKDARGIIILGEVSIQR